MNVAPTKHEILDQILLPLADEFEAGKHQGRTFTSGCPEEFEPLRECIAEMESEGWLVRAYLGTAHYLTPEGYRHFKPRIQALRALGKN
jgi:hypothetical protein